MMIWKHFSDPCTKIDDITSLPVDDYLKLYYELLGEEKLGSTYGHHSNPMRKRLQYVFIYEDDRYPFTLYCESKIPRPYGVW
jgi:hypothetical protein